MKFMRQLSIVLCDADEIHETAFSNTIVQVVLISESDSVLYDIHMVMVIAQYTERLEPSSLWKYTCKSTRSRP